MTLLVPTKKHFTLLNQILKKSSSFVYNQDLKHEGQRWQDEFEYMFEKDQSKKTEDGDYK